MEDRSVPLELVPALPADVLGFIAKGTLHRSDYRATLDPAVEDALSRHDKISLLYVLGRDFEGFSGGAIWADSEVGMSHARRFERIAVVTDQAWIRHSVALFGHLMPGEVKVFSVAEEADASEWLTSRSEAPR